MNDRTTVCQLFGCLMHCPHLLGQVDKYNLSIYDFNSRFDKYIYSAIKGLQEQGAKSIEPIDIANFLDSNVSAAKEFNDLNGMEFLQDAIEFSTIDTFDYYYNKLKKLNLLRDLKKSGFDTSIFYNEDLISAEGSKTNEQFESLTTKDICDTVKRKLLKIESDYAKTEEVQVMNMADGIEDFIKDLSESIDIGLPVQGKIYNKIISGAELGALTIRSGSSGLGKALPNSTIIPTPIGWRRVSEIQVGDYLFDAFGKPTKVLGVYPQGKKEVWQITFKDGRTAKCCDEHLWSYNTNSQKANAKKGRKFYTKSLKEIMQEPLQNANGTYRILVPMQKAVEYTSKKHYLPPYVMGLLLGDGSFRQQESNKVLQFSSQDAELPNAIGEAMQWIVKKGSSNNYSWYFATKENQEYQNDKINIWVEDALIEHPELINISSKEKFVPREYIEDSIDNRYALLQGLLDSDGHVDDKGRVSYYTISEKLRDDFIEIARSLGFKTHVIIDAHKETNIGYIVSIQGNPEDKIKLFKLKRKKATIEKWYNNTSRFEKNTHNPIVKIEKLNYSEEMTCFYVDNDEHLFLTENFIVTHNTRQAVADACYLAYPVRYDSNTRQWIQTGSSEKVLFIITEQTYKQIRKMVLAYLTDINESRFKSARLTTDEQERLQKAVQIINDFAENMTIVKMPSPTIELLKTTVREQCLTQDIHYVFFDYIFINPALLKDFKGFSLRDDEILLMVASALKDLAVELNVAMFTSTQVNAKADDNKNIRNEASLAGGRSTINKADNGAIMARPTPEEIEILQPLSDVYGTPNMVTDIFKVRSGEWTQVRIWSKVDLGRMKKEDLFITDARLDPIEDFWQDGDNIEVHNWDDEDYQKIKNYVNNLNQKGLLD